MRVLYTVHRYGEEVVGGAETACRLFAEKLVERGHSVDVLTSCAVSYVDWADRYAPGLQVINGVNVNRVPVSRRRDPVEFAEYHKNILRNPGYSTLADQMAWLDAMGPLLQNQPSHLRRLAAEADVAVFMTYLYPTTAYGVPVVSGDVTVVIQPTAHDEPPAHVPFFAPVMRSADALLYLTEEERDIASRIFGVNVPSVVTGIGLDVDGPSADGQRFRQLHGLGDDPYLLYIGRVDTFKGVSELMRYFVEFKGRNPSHLKLVIAGEQMMDLPEVDDIRYVGFVDEGNKADAIDGCVALVQPSPYESFSIVLCEAWRGRKPVLVQGYSEVLTGQCVRSKGGLPYSGFAEFEGCVRRILGDPALAAELGRNGHDYVRGNYSWSTVMTRYEHGLELGRERFRLQRASLDW